MYLCIYIYIYVNIHIPSRPLRRSFIALAVCLSLFCLLLCRLCYCCFVFCSVPFRRLRPTSPFERSAFRFEGRAETAMIILTPKGLSSPLAARRPKLSSGPPGTIC